VLVTVPPFPEYDITGPETLRVSLPSSVLISGIAVEVAADVVVRATAGTASVGGSLTQRGFDTYGATECCGQENYLQAPAFPLTSPITAAHLSSTLLPFPCRPPTRRRRL
jgi:hypothetical protein